MIERRPFETLGRFENDWLSARYHFSFAEWRDPERMGFGPLRVWNDDAVRPGRGFDPHGHRDMEILTFVRQGAITHEDHLGNRGRTEAGDVQVMTAGRGIVHSEYNRESGETTLFQIWITPNVHGLRPRWEQRAFPKSGGLSVLASGRPQDQGAGALTIHQDAALIGGVLRAGESHVHRLEPGRGAYLVPASGRVRIDGVTIAARDGAILRDMAQARIEALEDAQLALVDVPLG